ncbi:MAG: ABC transporter ATP-binding protein, partial [Actinobacteria bacterium]|nr:ABC transporter ATP-binding protein [Actinomycetota bacterium]
GKTILLTTHQLAVAQELASRIAVIRDGKIIADLPTGELLSRYAEDRFEVRTARIPNGLRPGVLPASTRIEHGAEATRILLPGAGQADLYRVLDGLRAAGIQLISVSQARPGLEDIFLRLIGDGAAGPGEAAGAAAAEQVA